MTNAFDSGSASRRAVLFSVDPSLAGSLESVLTHCGCQVEPASGGMPERADIVFCPSARPLLRRALSLFPQTPVIVVSRLPEVDGWLDALEEGAADYCAPPFETIQIRWLLETHAGAKQSMAAA